MRKYLIAGTTALMAASAMFVATPALAYEGDQNNCVGSDSQSTVGPGGTTTFTVSCNGQNGQGIEGATVNFAQVSGPAGCTVTFTPTATKTDKNGKASATVSFPANCFGQFVLGASINGSRVGATAAVTVTGGFPATSANAPPASPLPLLVLAMGLAMMVVGGAALVLRRR